MEQRTSVTRCRSKLVLACFFAAGIAAVMSCSRGDLGRGAVTTLSAWTPRPDSTGVASRTIDNAGFVDNGGRTSDETNRTQLSGMRVTESGSERITGTPGSGQPIPFIEPNPPRRGVERERLGPTIGPEGIAPSTAIPRPEPGPQPPPIIGAPSPSALDATSRIARARCDRQTACDRVGPGRAWESQDACMAQQRERADDEVASLACARGVDSLQLGLCLDSIRGQPCNESATSLDTVTECRTTAVCEP